MKKMSNSQAMAKSLEAISAVVVRQFDELSNSAGFHAIGAGKFFIRRVHRYLQNECIKWMFDIIDALGHAPDRFFDGRNEWAQKVCRAAIKAAEEQNLYYSRYRSEEDFNIDADEDWQYQNTNYKDIDKVREFFEIMDNNDTEE